MIDGELWVSLGLPSHVLDHGSRREAVPVYESGACPLEALNQAWDVDHREQLEHEVHMVSDDSRLENARPVALRLLWQKPAQEARDRIDEGLPLQGGPRQVDVHSNRHAPKLPLGDVTIVIKSVQRGVFLCARVLQDALPPSRDFSPS